MLGFLITRDDPLARVHATNAAVLGRDAAEARDRAPTPWEARRAAALLRSTEARERALAATLRGDGHRMIRERAGHALRGSTKPEELERLARVVSVAEIDRTATQVGLDLGQKLAKNMGRRVMDLLHDRDRERDRGL